MRKPDYTFTAKEQEVLDAYKSTLPNETISYSRMSYARKLMHVAQPDVIIMFPAEEWYEILVKEHVIIPSTRQSKCKGKAIYHFKHFIGYLNSVFDSGEHLDDWFEPEWYTCR